MYALQTMKLWMTSNWRCQSSEEPIVHTKHAGQHVQNDHYNFQNDCRICEKFEGRSLLASFGCNGGS
jgi:hypothetical protein